MYQYLAGALLGAALLAPTLAQADPILAVSWVDGAGQTQVQEHTLEALLAMDTVEVRTKNDYVPEMTTFTGPRLRDLFPVTPEEFVGTIRLTALNDYSATIPVEDVLNYDVIAAVLMEGEPMSVREKGPIWVIYPMSAHPELQEPIYNDRLIWQLNEIELIPRE